MDQYWQLVAVDTLDAVDAYSGGRLIKLFSSKFPESVVHNWAQFEGTNQAQDYFKWSSLGGPQRDLVNPGPPTEQRNYHTCGRPSKTSQARLSISGQAPLLSLPLKILQQILDQLDLGTLLRVIISCTTLWRIGWDHLELQVRRHALLKPWAGRRTVLLSNHCGVRQHPPGMLTEEESKLLDNGWPEDNMADDGGQQDLKTQEIENETTFSSHELLSGNLNPKPPLSLYNLAMDYSLRIRGDDRLFGPLHEILNRSVGENRLPLAERRVVEEFLCHPLTIYFPTSETWTLRSLTSKEFIHAKDLYSAFQQDGTCPFGPYIGYPGFGYAILSQIVWTPDRSDRLIQKINCGRWAGHRLDICPRSIHNQTSDTTWSDVSYEVIKDLRSIVQACWMHSERRKRTTMDGFSEFWGTATL